MTKPKSIEITDVLTADGIDRIKVGQVLVFSEASLKVTRKAKGRVWAKETRLYREAEIDEMAGEENSL